MKKRKVTIVTILVIAVIAMVGLSSCGNMPKEAPSKDKVEKVLKDAGFDEIKVPEDMKDSNVEEELSYVLNGDTGFSYCKYKDEKQAVSNAKETGEAFGGMLKTMGENDKVKPEVKDGKEGNVEYHSIMYKTSGGIVIQQDKSVLVMVMLTNDDKAFAKSQKSSKEVLSKLGYKNLI